MVLANFLADAWAEDGPFRQVPPNAVFVDQTANAASIVEIYSMELTDAGLIIRFGLLDGDAPGGGSLVAVVIDDYRDLCVKNPLVCE
jgi:hypothetical protein